MENNNISERAWEISIDTGGTFTDCIAVDPKGNRYKTKVLSNSSLRGIIKSCPTADTLLIEEEWEAPENFIKGFTFRVLENSFQEIKVVSYDPIKSIIHLSSSLLSMDIAGC